MIVSLPNPTEREVIEAMKFFASAFAGTRARWFRLTIAPVLLISLLSLVIVGAGCSDDDGDDVTFPTAPPAEQMNWLFDVHGTSANDVYACGNKGAMFHYDGSSWSYVDMGSGSPITTLQGSDDGTLYAAGHDGKIWQNAGGTWSSMSSGTSQDLYGLGTFNSETYACGAEGTLRKLSGNSWTSVGQVMVVRSPALPYAVQDTFMLNEDVASLVTVNQYFLGGAYRLPDFEGDQSGLNGTTGMVMSPDAEPDLYDWELRPLGADQFALSEWIGCTTSDIFTLANNYLGTSEGWLYQLILGDSGNFVWSKMSPDLTESSATGVRDIWLDEDSNLYIVTDEGDMIFQTRDYNYSEDIGMRKFFHISHSGLTSIWGADTDQIFMTGFTANTVFEAAMDFSDTTLTFTAVPMEFPNKGGQSIGMFEDHLGMPRR